MKKPQLVVLDTNIIVSVMLFGGQAAEILRLLENNKIKISITREILQEYIRVLSYPKFSLTEDEIRYLIDEMILPFSKTARSTKLLASVCSDPDDDKFLACALSARAEAIVSGDKALLEIKNFEKIPILSLKSFLSVFIKPDV